MAIDITSERVLTLAEAAERLPRRRRGRPTHVSCLYRWTTSGFRGVVLESVQIGGTRCTSVEALSRFFAEIAPEGAINSRSTVSESLEERVRRAERVMEGRRNA